MVDGNKTMGKYHVGCGIGGIYAGRTRKGKSDEWLDKSLVTDETLLASGVYLLTHNRKLWFEYNGRRYVLDVNPYRE